VKYYWKLIEPSSDIDQFATGCQSGILACMCVQTLLSSTHIYGSLNSEIFANCLQSCGTVVCTTEKNTWIRIL